MANERNYARFYTLLKKLPGADKETLVAQYTDGRTSSLRETTRQEYDRMCRDMERETGCDEFVEGIRRQLRQKRSVCLKLMQQLGIDTTDWDRVNTFCQDARIAGKLFRKISIDELEELAVKLRTIKRKGGLKPKSSRDEHRDMTSFVYIPMSNIAES
ncbi:hypothetical protein [Segatella maculosa]|uniref:hypothetical protein n=1 Tax=Segatella maculosa TaxID=439703 RepID=UPI002490006E|nr:hypothetical protein [Segatella maculosa]